MQYQEVTVGRPVVVRSQFISAEIEKSLWIVQKLESQSDIALASFRNEKNAIVLTGTPVGQGSVMGKARVVTSLAEANTIQVKIFLQKMPIIITFLYRTVKF